MERWRAAIEDYQPVVRPGNRTRLGEAKVPFAIYINAAHQRIHPVFAAALDSLGPASGDQVTYLEIVLGKDRGEIVRMGVVRSSGVAALDVAALGAVDRAQPFGPAPDVIASPDGNVYLRWEFHRDPYESCRPRNVRPFLLAAPPASDQR